MSAADFVLPREWCPDDGEQVVDDRPASRGRTGTVVSAEAGGPHFADRDWWVDVRWDDGAVESRVASHWLFRPDGTQGLQ